MNIKILLQALNATWLIEPTAANNYALVLHKLITGQRSSFLHEEDDQPEEFAWSTNEDAARIGSITDAVDNGIAVITLRGAVMKYDYCGAPGTQSVMKALQQANDNPSLSAIILEIDSPGGAVDGTQQLANAIKNSKKPVVAYVNGMMCSAAMWIGSAASKRIASSNTDTIGSIGTMASWRDAKCYWEKEGVKFHEVYATASTHKNLPFREAEKGNYESLITTWLDPTNEEFISAIQENLPNADKAVLNGAAYIAKDAKKKGLIDSIGTFDDAVKAALNLGKQQQKLQQTIKSNQMNWPKFLAFLNTNEVASANEITLDEQAADNIEAVIAERDTLLATKTQLANELATANASLQKANEDLQAANTTIANLQAEVEKLGKEDAVTPTTASAEEDATHENGLDPSIMDFQKQLFSKV